MLSKAFVMGVVPVDHWGPESTVAGVLMQLGQNSGNILFAEALKRVLFEPVSSGYSIPTNDSGEGDAVVIAAANWINEFEDFTWLASALERTTLPAFLVGVGAQAGLDHAIPKLKDGTLRALKIISERSALIAARGEFTCEVLSHYGIKNVVPTGCPSLLLAGRAGPQFSREATADKVIVHGTRHGFGLAEPEQTWLYRQAFKHGHEILLQSEHADIYYAMGSVNNAAIMEKASSVVTAAYGVGDADAIARYLLEKGKFFSNIPDWMAHMQTRNFCVGSRIHGTVASIVAGTPATLLVHDSRTLEMAKAMGIPYVHLSALDMNRDLPLETLIEAYETSKVFAGYGTYFKNYMDFFARNNLKVAADLVS